MNFDVAPQFERSLKGLKKKYPSIKEDILQLQSMLNVNPYSGISLGSGIYKVRLASSDLKKGKRGGFRIIYFLLIAHETIVLLDIYSKNVRETVSVAAIKVFIDEYLSKKK